MMNNREYVITPSKSNGSLGPLVFLFGWAGCQDAYLAKYSKLYEDNNMTTVRIVQPFNGTVPGPDHARTLQPAFEEVNAAEREIIFHLFSMNGITSLISLWQIFDQTPNGHQIKSQIKGIIFDSCPSYVTPWAASQVTAMIQAQPGETATNRTLRQLALFLKYTVGNAGTFMKSFWDPKIYERVKLFHRTLSLTDLPQNQLYLYSKADELCNYQTIDRFREEQERRGKSVDYIRFEDSPHVEHGRKYPEQYQNASKAFLRIVLVHEKSVETDNYEKRKTSKL